jgi:hypothetical protein
MNKCGRIVTVVIHTCWLSSQGPPPEPPCAPAHVRAAVPDKLYKKLKVLPTALTAREAAHDAAVAAHDAAVAAHDAAVARTLDIRQLKAVEKDKSLADPLFDGRRAPAEVKDPINPKRDPSGDNADDYKRSGATKKYPLDNIKVPD